MGLRLGRLGTHTLPVFLVVFSFSFALGLSLCPDAVFCNKERREKNKYTERQRVERKRNTGSPPIPVSSSASANQSKHSIAGFDQ